MPADPRDLARVADIRARADAAAGSYLAHRRIVRDDVPWLLDRLAAETERADKWYQRATEERRVRLTEAERADVAEAAVRVQVFAEVDAALVREAAKPLGDSVRLGIGVARLAVRSQLRNACPTCSGSSRETVGMVCQTCGTDYGAIG